MNTMHIVGYFILVAVALCEMDILLSIMALVLYSVQSSLLGVFK